MAAQLLLIILIIMFLAMSLRMASEYQRFVLFRLGRYSGLKGPGLALFIPIIDRFFPISVGDQGQLSDDGIGKFGEIKVPVDHNEKVHTGSIIKVNGFLNNKIQVVLDTDYVSVV
ncbi:MAG: hypothetical protein A4E62_02571 [Syntrophorhabdus sp. PtaU1.Bin002]|nr:MAG: hypothetical protein A4E58_00237 [Syntrophorhabdus sp. PtaB.Bin006]OPY66046.1 MAG: hypothetical protein A4E62_02571 [Syntrophorhabdus sp. PtaU1.Bin002]